MSYMNNSQYFFITKLLVLDDTFINNNHRSREAKSIFLGGNQCVTGEWGRKFLYNLIIVCNFDQRVKQPSASAPYILPSVTLLLHHSVVLEGNRLCIH